MATNSQLFTGLALRISPSASLQQASPLSFNNVYRAKKSLTTPFLNPGFGLGTLKINNARDAVSYQSRGGRHRRFLLRASFFDDCVKSFADGASSLLKNLIKLADELGGDIDPGMDYEMITLQRLLEQALAHQEHYESLYKAAHKISEQWHKNARVLLGKGEEDLARVALKRWMTFGDDAKELKLLFEKERNYGYLLLCIAKPFAGWIQRTLAKEQRQAASFAFSTATKVSETLEFINTTSASMSEQIMGEKLKTDELDKKYALESTALDDDRAIAIFKEELAAVPTTEEEHQPRRWWSPFNGLEVEREITVLRREIEEGK